ncbi:unnamed protein product [Auanema sp. JU1783]|nr:unnamed protein product [Auanema sp. JU1783]
MKLYFFAFAILSLAASASAFCPDVFQNQTACTCSENVEGIIVKCSGHHGPLVIEELKKQHHELRELTIENANIVEIGPRAFKNLRIKKLNMDNNRIRKIHHDAFSGLENSLVELSMSNNKLTDIPTKSLSNLRALSILQMKCNKIGNLTETSFINISTLIDLDLSCNKICEISKDAFGSIKSTLQNLILDSNCMKNFPGEALKGMDSLIGVHMKYNKLQEIEKNSIVNMPSLSLLTLSNNNISYIHPGCVENSDNIHYVYLSDNRLTGIDSGVMSQFKQVQVLDLSFNLFEKIDETTFTGMDSLQHLNLDSNYLTEVVPRSFEGMPLLLLWLPNNCIRNISQNLFQGIPYLRQLSLTNNYISEIQPLSFLHLANLHHLDLSNNQILNLQQGAISGSDHLTVRLQENPMVCTADGFHVMNGREAINLTTEPNLICKGNWRKPMDQTCAKKHTRPYHPVCCGVEETTPGPSTTTTAATTTEMPEETEKPVETVDEEESTEEEEEEVEESTTEAVSTTTEETTTRKINMMRFMRLQQATAESKKTPTTKHRPRYMGFMMNDRMLASHELKTTQKEIREEEVIEDSEEDEIL